jgi:DNA-binding response OmpR family regulator
VQQTKGHIWVYSVQGKGTTFKIYLPRVDEPLQEITKEILKEELPRGNETILIVEDEEEVRKLAGKILEKQGYRILETFNGDEALVVCERGRSPIHLMLADIVMPGMSGSELAKRVKPLYPEMKVLYMSGYTDDAIVRHGVLEKGVNYIQKPFTMEGLARRVREVLDKEPHPHP